jgi:isopentenyl-diphosphate Delta-isomerase
MAPRRTASSQQGSFQGSLQVSFDNEPLILVDAADRQVGTASKAACHDGAGMLHRAFSVFLFDARGRVLLQQRSREKRLWPLYWANSCCSHPRLGEPVYEAAVRRVREELALEAELEALYTFEYQARFGESGSEHELCHVLVGRAEGEVRVNPREIAAHRFISASELDGELASDTLTPWLKLEWPRLRTEFAAKLRAFGVA